MRISIILLLAGTPVTAFAHQAQPEIGPSWEVSSGVEYESGDYGTGSDIEIVSVPNRLGATIGRVQLVAAIPYYWIEGPADVIPGNVLGLPLLPQPDADSVTRKGWGDLELGAAYALPVETVNLSLSGSVKLPTAENGLGTGESDYTIGAELSKALSEKIIPFASFSYTLPGSPDGIALQDRYAATGGVVTWLGSKVQFYASYRYAENPDAVAISDQRVQTGLNAWVGSGLSLGVYGSAGLSKGAPDQSVGLRIGLAPD